MPLSRSHRPARTANAPRGARPPRRAHGHEAGTGSALGVALALGLLASLLAPSAPALVRESWLVRAVVSGGVLGLCAVGRFAPALAALIALVASALGELALAGAGQPLEPVRALGTLALAGGVAAGVALLGRWGRSAAAASALLTFVLLSHLWIAGALPGPYRQSAGGLLARLKTEPVAGHYDFDGDIYLRTYFMMKRGEPFYGSFSQACAEDARGLGAPRSTLNYREPFLFELWRWLPGRNGVDLRNWFLAFVAVVMVCGYHLARTLVGPGPALLAPLALAGYFATAAWSRWFLFPELWAGGLAVIAALALLRGRWWSALVLITAAVAVRELMVFLVPAFLLGRMLHPLARHRRSTLVAGLVLPVVPLAAHLAATPATSAGTAWDLSPWLHGGFGTLVDCLRFSSNFVPLGPLLLPWAPALALLGAALARPTWRAALVATAIGTALIGLITFSAGLYGLYWGAILQPLALGVLPLAARWWERGSAEPEEAASTG